MNDHPAFEYGGHASLATGPSRNAELNGHEVVGHRPLYAPDPLPPLHLPPTPNSYPPPQSAAFTPNSLPAMAYPPFHNIGSRRTSHGSSDPILHHHPTTVRRESAPVSWQPGYTIPTSYTPSEPQRRSSAHLPNTFVTHRPSSPPAVTLPPTATARNAADGQPRRPSLRIKSEAQEPGSATFGNKRQRIEKDELDSDSASEGEGVKGDMTDVSKLEMKREKNRIKQRNLRLRRANHINDLETQVASLNTTAAELKSKTKELTVRQSNLERYVNDLETIMSRAGLAKELQVLRAAWNGLEYAGRVEDALQSSRSDSANPQSSEVAAVDSVLFGMEMTFSQSQSGSTDISRDALHSPRSLSIADLLSPSATPDDHLPTVYQASSHWYRPLNMSFEVEPWMMDQWLHMGIPSEMGDPMDLMDEEHVAELRTVQSSTSYGGSTGGTPHYSLQASNVHPCVRIARRMLLAVLPDTSGPVSTWSLAGLDAVQQRVILAALSQLCDPNLRAGIMAEHIGSLPPDMLKLVMEYQDQPDADLRLPLLPLPVLRAAIIGFYKQNVPFDLTAFITHILADARIYGDVSDACGWQMTSTFWDIWDGYFPGARPFFNSLTAHCQRTGGGGSTVLEIIMGQERPAARMKCQIGKPKGWTMPTLPDKPDLVEL